MKRCLSALAASVMLALGAGAGVASAGGTLVPPPQPTLDQTNGSGQDQVQVAPIAPQVNVQNVNVLTLGDVEQGDANNANTGQATQQENAAAGGGGSSAASGGKQSNASDQSQVQVAPIAPQVNVQNVNVLASGDVEQGDANNANTGQAAQQENTAAGGKDHPCRSACEPKHEPKACERKCEPDPCREPCRPKPGPDPCDAKCPSGDGPRKGGQSNSSDQSQVQLVPIAPQVNVQNVNVLASGDVEQGDANNANTGQAAQQENTAAGSKPSSCKSACPPKHEPKPCERECRPKPCERKCEPKRCERKCEPAPCREKCRPKSDRDKCGSKCPTTGRGSAKGDQQNRSRQKQVQVVPIAPQVNVQNVNVLTSGDVRQGDANNANTGQAAQQENTQVTGRGTSPGSCGAGQSNTADQSQVQLVPIAPQVNLQNVNVLTSGDVRQGDANNANTGQASQQSNTLGGPPPTAAGGLLPRV